MSRTKIDLAIIGILILICGLFALGVKFLMTGTILPNREKNIEVVRKDMPARDPNENLFLASEAADWNNLKNLPAKAQETGTVRVPILLYHHIEPAPEGEIRSYYVSPQTFERQMKWLYNNSYNVIPLSNLVAYLQTGQNRPPEKSVVITFDDGTIGQYESAFPTLQTYNFPATFYVVKQWTDEGQAGQKGGYFGWDEAKEMVKAGMEIGSHSIDHKDLAGLTDEESKYEIFQSKVEIEKNLGSAITAYAFSGGSMTARDRAYIQEANYSSGSSVLKGIDHRLADLWGLHRMHIDDDLPYFIARIEGKYDR